jgi:hypothetical protein
MALGQPICDEASVDCDGHTIDQNRDSTVLKKYMGERQEPRV